MIKQAETVDEGIYDSKTVSDVLPKKGKLDSCYQHMLPFTEHIPALVFLDPEPNRFLPKWIEFWTHNNTDRKVNNPHTL